MQLDPQQSLQLVFRHLEHFSLPGIGTFRKVRIAAQVDHQSKRVLPPQERFQLEEGEAEKAELEGFLFRHFKLSLGDAEAQAVQLGQYLLEQVDETGLAGIDGVGLIKQEEGGGLLFVPDEGVHSQVNDLFGLQAVDFTIAGSTQPSTERKKEAARTSTLANQTVVQPAPPRKRFPIGWFLFLMIVGGLGFAAYQWRDELKLQLEKAGLWSSSQPDSEKVDEPLVLADSLEKIRQQVLDDSLAKIQAAYSDSLRIADSMRLAMEAAKKPTPKPAPTTQPVPKPIPAPKPVIAPKPSPKPVATPKPAPTGVGEAAVRGTYYLVVSSVLDATEAEVIAKSTKGAKLLAPPAAGGYYKISVFDSRNKQAVIQQMVALKAKYSKSWIYWPGMVVTPHD